jgi:hypothetical protein
VTLARVYCGLASASQDARLPAAEATLVAAIVDDAGRLLDVCEVADSPAGYARLAATLVERSSRPSGAALAADRADHVVTSLLTAAGSPLAIVDDEAIDDYAERFADDGSTQEVQSTATTRRAVGLARALQAGAIWALTLATPPEIAAHKPVLAAHAALAHGRRAAATTLRQVLRELYPAALRAYPDPADPVVLAVLDAIPEPGMLGASGPGRTGSVDPDAIVAHLGKDRIADEQTVAAAVTALRVAVAETPRRDSAGRAVTSAVADAVRQAVAAVRACDAGCEALVATLGQRRTRPSAGTPKRSGWRSEEVGMAQRAAPEPVAGRRARSQPVANGSPVTPRPLTPPPVAPRPAAARPADDPPAAAWPAAPVTAPPANAPVTAPPANAPVTAPPARVWAGQQSETPFPAGQAASALPNTALSETTPADRAEPAVRPMPPSAPRSHREQPVARPVSVPPPPPPGITPIVPSQRRRRTAESDESVQPAVAPAAPNRSRSERIRSAVPPRSRKGGESSPAIGFSATDYSIPVPVPRPAADPAGPGSRGNWPLVNSSEDRDSGSHSPYDDSAGRTFEIPAEPSGEPRVTPPWLADDLPPEPPMLRLVEPPPLADRALRDESRDNTDDLAESGVLRLMDVGRSSETARRDRPSLGAHDRALPPVPDEGDGDLLIFAEIRSAWFSGEPAGSDADWGSLDPGWQAAEHAAQPAIGEETNAGLPRRVPQANLVPGSPLREERPLRIVRDPESIAAHTTGYFRGYRRGQEIGGYAVGGRPGREAAGGWDFARDQSDDDESADVEYRSAGHRF